MQEPRSPSHDRYAPPARPALPALSAKEFRRRVLAPVDGVFLFQARSLNRLIQEDVGSSILAGTVAHTDYYLIRRESFLLGLESENPDALQVIEGLQLPAWIVLLPMPTAADLASTEPERLLLHYWAVRTEAEAARTWQALRDELGDIKRFGLDDLRRVVGEIAVREIAELQRRDLKVLETADETQLVRSFIGTSVRLARFQEQWRASCFPAVERWDEVDAWVAASGVDALDVLERSRPTGVRGTPAEMEAIALEEEGIAPGDDMLALETDHGHVVPGEFPVRATSVYAQDSHLWSVARLWWRRHPVLFEAAVEKQRERCTAVVTRRLAVGEIRERKRWLAWDIAVTFWGWLRFVLLYMLLGSVVRQLAAHSGNATRLALLLEGFAVRSHWRAARKSAARGNAGEVLRRLNESLWHYRLLQLSPEVQSSALGMPLPQDDEVSSRLRQDGDTTVESIVAGFQQAFVLSGTEADALRELVRALADPAQPGRRGRKGRMLKDIYKASLDVGRSFARIQLVSWILSLGRSPLRQPLQYQGALKALRQLRAASQKLDKLPWPLSAKERLGAPVLSARKRILDHMRSEVRPKLDASLREAGFVPKTPREHVALQKICDELVDTLLTRWHLRYSDLRDAIARNDLRLEDPTGLELLAGDELTRLNSLLANRLVGVYERAEVYLQVLQRGSTLMFATTTGRFATRFLVIPYMGAYVVIVGFAHLFDPVSRLFGGPYLLAPHVAEPMPGDLDFPPPTVPPDPAQMPGPLDDKGTLWAIVVALGTLSLLAIHTATGRELLRGFARKALAALRLIASAPRYFLRTWQPLQRLLRTQVARQLSRFLLQPVLLGLILISPLLIYHWARGIYSRLDVRWILASGFIVGFLLINSKSGRSALDSGAYRASDALKQAKNTLILGLFHWIMDLSDQALGLVEHVIYRVDDLIRFREGENRFTIGFKAIAQLGWSAVTYFIRIYVNLLIEPQVNPIKHFPVVTVSHKLMLPFLGGITAAMISFISPPIPLVPAQTFAWITVFLLPGFFGFLVWEFKENWKLYRANHPRSIRPVLVGSHGETARTMLRRGFHSGTIPKIFDKLRRSLFAARPQRTRQKIHVARQKLRHARQEMEHFLERELVASLRHHEAVRAGFSVIEGGRVKLATQSMTLTVKLARQDAAAGSHVELLINYRMEADKLQADVVLRSPERLQLSADERRGIAHELDAFLQRSAATFDPEAINMALHTDARAARVSSAVR